MNNLLKAVLNKINLVGKLINILYNTGEYSIIWLNTDCRNWEGSASGTTCRGMLLFVLRRPPQDISCQCDSDAEDPLALCATCITKEER